MANLAEALGPHLTSRISLEPLTEAGQTRQVPMPAAVTGLAQHLAALPDSPPIKLPGSRGVPWRSSWLPTRPALMIPGLATP